MSSREILEHEIAWCSGCDRVWAAYERAIRRHDGQKALRALGRFDVHRDRKHGAGRKPN